MGTLTALAAQAHTLANAHPVVYGAVSALAGAVGWHQALAWLETNGVDKAVTWFKKRQRAAAKNLGFTDAQISAAEQKEAAETLKIAQRAAADLAAAGATDEPQKPAATDPTPKPDAATPQP